MYTTHADAFQYVFPTKPSSNNGLFHPHLPPAMYGFKIERTLSLAKSDLEIPPDTARRLIINCKVYITHTTSYLTIPVLKLQVGNL